LLPRCRRVFGPLFGLQAQASRLALESLNQATWAGYIRQERAKRSGHHAEHRLALLLQQAAIPFCPAEKAENPLCRDARICEVSFDLVIPSLEAPLVCV